MGRSNGRRSRLSVGLNALPDAPAGPLRTIRKRRAVSDMSFRSWWFSLVALAVVLLWFLGVPPAHAHGGVDSGQSVGAAWNWEPTVPLGILLAGALYVAGLRNWKNPSHPVNSWRRVSFFAGLGAILLALQSPLDPLSDHLFLAHQVQHLLLRMVGPPLILLGAPLTPLLRGLPVAARQQVVRPLAGNPALRRLYAFLTHPMVAALLFLGTLFFWQGQGPHNLSLRNDIVHYLMHLSMLFSGILFWWVIIDPKPHRSRMPYVARALYLGFQIFPNTLLGAIVTFSPGVLYTAYGEVERLWGISLMADQAIGGTILWIPGDMMFLIAAGIMVGLWLRQEEEKGRAGAALPRPVSSPGPPGR